MDFSTGAAAPAVSWPFYTFWPFRQFLSVHMVLNKSRRKFMSQSTIRKFVLKSFCICTLSSRNTGWSRLQSPLLAMVSVQLACLWNAWAFIAVVVFICVPNNVSKLHKAWLTSTARNPFRVYSAEFSSFRRTLASLLVFLQDGVTARENSGRLKPVFVRSRNKRKS